MALQAWDKNYREELKIQQAQIESLQQQLMISGAGGSPGQPYTPPTGPKPNEPYVPAPGRDKLAGLRINPNTIMLPKEPAPAETDDDYGEGAPAGHPDWKMSHGGPFYNEYGQPISDPSKGHSHNGVPLPQIDHLKQTPEEMEENERIHNQNYPHPSHALQAMNYPPPSALDKWLQLYQGQGGSLRHIDPDLRKLILQRGAMKANLPANNIRRLQDTGHMTILENADGTGLLRIIDSLGPPPPRA